MPIYTLGGDETGLPETRLRKIKYEIEALSPRDMWGAGNGATVLVCKQTWRRSDSWIRDMVGRVRVSYQEPVVFLDRDVPESVNYGGTDRVQFCSTVDQTEQGDNPDGDAAKNFSNQTTNWPATDWCKYRVVYESFPYQVLHTTEAIGALPSLTDVWISAGPHRGARELYRYVVRTRKTYSREQPIPSATRAGGFKIIDDAVEANRKPIGQCGFRVVGMADVQYKWVRVPVGWPPPLNFIPRVAAKPWPPKFNPAADDPTNNRRSRDSFKGTINHDWFDCGPLDGYCWPPGELLYLGFDDSYKYYDAAGDWVCDVVFSFKAKEGGWNKFLSANGEWVEVSLTGLSTGTRPYQTNNFNRLFEH